MIYCDQSYPQHAHLSDDASTGIAWTGALARSLKISSSRSASTAHSERGKIGEYLRISSVRSSRRITANRRLARCGDRRGPSEPPAFGAKPRVGRYR